jgi:predicted HTH transcriptional regulator
MRFDKPPQLMDHEELVERVRTCIVDRWPESGSLDYKQVLNIDTRPDRIELAKDISSFANDLGGTLLYGVPEEKDAKVPIPAPLDKCGLDVGQSLETIENILLESIRPVLPNLFVKSVLIPEI